MSINIRVAFPITMFILAAASFTYGAYQHFAVRAERATGSERLAFILESIEESGASPAQKQQLYASIAEGLPSSTPVLGIDFSGSFAAPETGDQCTNDGQRTLCRALRLENASSRTISSVCGTCHPR